MSQEHLKAVSEAIHNLFDPKYFELNKKRRVIIDLAVKKQYLEHYLSHHWIEICGKTLADRCCLDHIENNILYVNTQTASMANELFMMKDVFLQKVNALLDKSMMVQDVRFRTGKFKKNISTQELQKTPDEPDIVFTTCPRCGAKMQQGLKVCNSCDHELKVEQRDKIIELLRVQPWLKYEECNTYLPCNPYLFSSVKESLKNYYFEQVISGYATELEKQKAVLLLKELPPEEITDDIYNKAMSEFAYYRQKRLADQKKWRENNVSTSRR